MLTAVFRAHLRQTLGLWPLSGAVVFAAAAGKDVFDVIGLCHHIDRSLADRSIVNERNILVVYTDDGQRNGGDFILCENKIVNLGIAFHVNTGHLRRYANRVLDGTAFRYVTGVPVSEYVGADRFQVLFLGKSC